MDLVRARNRLNSLQRHNAEPEVLAQARADLAAAHIYAAISENVARTTPEQRSVLAAMLTAR